MWFYCPQAPSLCPFLVVVVAFFIHCSRTIFWLFCIFYSPNRIHKENRLPFFLSHSPFITSCVCMWQRVAFIVPDTKSTHQQLNKVAIVGRWTFCLFACEHEWWNSITFFGHLSGAASTHLSHLVGTMEIRTMDKHTLKSQPEIKTRAEWLFQAQIYHDCVAVFSMSISVIPMTYRQFFSSSFASQLQQNIYTEFNVRPRGEWSFVDKNSHLWWIPMNHTNNNEPKKKMEEETEHKISTNATKRQHTNFIA